jgi:hypothetical protein
MSLAKEDIADLDLIDAVELGSDGTVSFKTVPGTDVVTGTVSTNPANDFQGLQFGDEKIEVGDKAVLSGASAGDGIYTVATIVDNTDFTVVEAIVDSTGGSWEFRHAAGALSVGVDPTGLTFTSATNVQEALEDLGTGSGITPGQHRDLDQLVHEIAEDNHTEVIRTAGKVTQVVVWTDNGKTTKIRETQITRTAGKVTQVVEIQYDGAGVVIVGETKTTTITRTAGKVTSLDEVMS